MIKEKIYLMTLSLGILYAVLFLLNERFLFVFFPYTGLGVIGTIFIMSILFIILLIGFGFVAARENVFLSIFYFLFATIFIIIYGWKSHPSDVGQYPWLELKRCYSVANNFDVIELDSLFGSRYSRVAAIYKFEKELPDFAFRLSKNNSSTRFFCRNDSILFTNGGWSSFHRNDSVIIMGDFKFSILERELTLVNGYKLQKDENGDIVSLENIKLVPETKLEKLFYRYLSW